MKDWDKKRVGGWDYRLIFLPLATTTPRTFGNLLLRVIQEVMLKSWKSFLCDFSGIKFITFLCMYAIPEFKYNDFVNS
jgi:hypothetical protein